MPRETFPVASIIVSAYHMVPMYVIMITACLFIGWQPDPLAILAAVMALAIVFIWGLGIALLLERLERLLPRHPERRRRDPDRDHLDRPDDLPVRAS